MPCRTAHVAREAREARGQTEERAALVHCAGVPLPPFLPPPASGAAISVSVLKWSDCRRRLPPPLAPRHRFSDGRPPPRRGIPPRLLLTLPSATPPRAVGAAGGRGGWWRPCPPPRWHPRPALAPGALPAVAPPGPECRAREFFGRLGRVVSLLVSQLAGAVGKVGGRLPRRKVLASDWSVHSVHSCTGWRMVRKPACRSLGWLLS